MSLVFKTLRQLQAEQKKKTPAEILLYLGMISVFMLFLPLLIKIFRSRFHSASLPNEFALSSLIVMAGSWFLRLSKLHKSQDRHKHFRYALLLVVISGCLFLVLQLLALKKIFVDTPGGPITFFAVLVIYHIIQFIIMLIVVALILVRTVNIRTSADFYIYFLNHRNSLLYKSATNCWGYLVSLWILVYVSVLIKMI